MGDKSVPNRILREGILTSERVDSLSSWAVECFYRRLHSIVDDFGLYYANPSLIRAAAYPLKLDKVSNADVDKWLADCAGAGLVSTYEVDGKRYLRLLDFRQQRRAVASKFPQPPSDRVADATQATGSGIASAHLVVGGVGVEGDKSNVGLAPDATSPSKANGSTKREAARKLLAFLNEQAGKHFLPTETNLDFILARLEEYDEKTLRGVVVDRVGEWKADEKMQEYLRPATLFNKTKCAQYVGGLPT